jgi:MFS superfamily sulfate permease-like transporter
MTNISNPFKNFVHDLPASLVVFLVALPLCLGIALASGAPMFSGIIAGVVGGIVVGSLSGSNLSVSGPAAGLTTIVIAAIGTLGSFETFLCSVVLAGVIQIVLGYLRAGSIGNFFPSAVIKGMLAAIGLILILKQIPHGLGYDRDFEGDESFVQSDGENTFTEIWNALDYITPGAVIISIIANSAGAGEHKAKASAIGNIYTGPTGSCGRGYFSKRTIKYLLSFTGRW